MSRQAAARKLLIREIVFRQRPRRLLSFKPKLDGVAEPPVRYGCLRRSGWGNPYPWRSKSLLIGHRLRSSNSASSPVSIRNYLRPQSLSRPFNNLCRPPSSFKSLDSTSCCVQASDVLMIRETKEIDEFGRAATAISCIPPWLARGLGCRDLHLSTAKENPDTQHGL